MGTEFVTKGNDYYVLPATIKRDFNETDQMPRFIVEKNVDGVIIAGKVPLTFISQLSKYKFPIVFVDFYPPHGDYNVVLIDNIKGGFLATKHLIELGHKNIAFVGGDITHPSITDRLIGYKQALESSGLSINLDLIITDEDYPARANGYNAAKRLLSSNKNVTAIFACNDAMALGIIQYCSEYGIKVPDDISIVGFDDVESDISLTPMLTTIRVPKTELGIEAMNLMVNILKEKENLQTKKILVPVELIVRNSTKSIIT